MANMRYRKPSVKTILGITKWKKRAKKALGINKVLAPFRAVNNFQRRALRRAGYYSPEMKAMRAAQQGKVAGPIGAIKVSDDDAGGKNDDNNALLMAAMLAQGDKGKKGGDDDNPLLMAAMLAQGQDKGKGKGRGLAEAMLLSSMMKGDDEESTPKARHAARGQAHKAKQADDDEEASGDDHPRSSRSRKKPSEDQPAPKRHRGWRLFGLFLVALLVAVTVVTVWYYWIA